MCQFVNDNSNNPFNIQCINDFYKRLMYLLCIELFKDKISQTVNASYVMNNIFKIKKNIGNIIEQ